MTQVFKVAMLTDGAIQVLRNAVGGHISLKKRYEGVWFNVISITGGGGWVDVEFPEKQST